MTPHGIGVCPRSIGSYQWGCTASLVLTEGATVANSYDVVNIPNIVSWQTDAITDTLLRDDSQPDGWKAQGRNSEFRYGYVQLAGYLLGHEEGEVIPLGLYETLQIIRHRNDILSHVDPTLPNPETDRAADESERDALKRMTAAVTSGHQYYFPAASHCHAFEPTVDDDEELADKFKAHNWFLPTLGELAHVSCMLRRTGNEDVFAKAKTQGFLSVGMTHNTSESMTKAEYAPSGIEPIDVSTGARGGWNGISKATSYQVLPMVAF